MVADGSASAAVVLTGTPRASGSPKKGDKQEDVLDREDFNVTHYINEMFPTGVGPIIACPQCLSIALS